MLGISKDFSQYKVPQSLAKARTVRTMMANNEAFPLPWPPTVPTVEILEQTINLLDGSYNAAKNRDLEMIALRDEHHKQLKDQLRKLGSYVNLVAEGNEEKLQSSGFDLLRQSAVIKTKTAIDRSATVKVRLVRGKVNGTLLLRASALKDAAGYHVMITDGDPSLEENWRELGTFGRASRIEIPGLTRGRDYTVRVRGLFGNGYGPWSLPVTEMPQ